MIGNGLHSSEKPCFQVNTCGSIGPGLRRDDERSACVCEHHREVGLLDHEPRRHDRADDAGGRREVRVQRDVREEADAAEVDAERRARVEAEPAEPEDQRSEDGVGHVVARDRVRAPVLAEPADSGPEEQRSG